MEKRDKVLEFLLKLLCILNLLDGVFTITLVESGLAYETNPLLAGLLSISPVLFILVKLLLVQPGVLLLWHMRKKKYVLHAAAAVNIVYGSIIVYHIINLITLL